MCLDVSYLAKASNPVASLCSRFRLCWAQKCRSGDGGGGGGVLQGLCLGDLGSGWHRAPVMLLQSCTLRRVTGLLQPYSLTVLYVLS